MQDFVIEKPAPRPPIITLFGDAGTGKNSLATAIARNPIVIRAEDGAHRQSKLLEVPDVLPVCRSGREIIEQMRWLYANPGDYTDLIVDSGSAADVLFVADVIANGGKNGKPAKSLTTAYDGFGNGFSVVEADHARIRKAADALNVDRGFTIIFILHADLETMKLPDMEDYQRWTLRLTRSKSTNPQKYYVDNVDFVGQVRLASALRGDDDERKRVVSNGDREIVCYSTASSVTKNSYGIKDALDFPEGTNPLAPYLNTEKPARRRRARVEPDATEDEQPDGDV